MENKELENADFYGKKRDLYKTSDDALFSFVLKKSERLTAALYLISSIISDSEPLKWHLRGEGLKFLHCVRDSHSVGNAGHLNALTDCANVAEGVVSVLEIGRLSGLISDMNFSLLKNEYRQLIDLLRQEPHANGLAKDVPIKEEFLRVDKPRSPDRTLPPQMELSSEQKNPGVIESGWHPRGEHIGQEKDIKDRSNVFNNVPYNPSRTSSVVREKGKRRATIIKILQKKSDLTIKDIAQAIPGCSEKTVQRELIALIKDNVIARKGERRWSRYSML